MGTWNCWGVDIHEDEDTKYFSRALNSIFTRRIVKRHNADITALTAERDEALRRLEMAEAERDVLNGSACATEQADGCGPCGVCKDCLKAERDEWKENFGKAMAYAEKLEAERDELQRRLDAVVAMLEPGSAPCDCEICGCGNIGNMKDMAAWQADKWAHDHAKAIAEGEA